MALSEININDIVLNEVNRIIIESEYTVLHQFLLERKPLPPVVNYIDHILNESSIADKNHWAHQFIQAACQAQITADAEQQQSDEREKNSDLALAAKYQSELPGLQIQSTQLESSYLSQRGKYTMVQNEVSQLQGNLSAINRDLAQVRNERLMLNLAYPYQYAAPYYTHHLNHHHHYHCNTTPYVYSPTYNFMDQMTWDRLNREESRLLAEQSRITTLLQTKESECSMEKSTLNTIMAAKTKVSETCRSMRHDLETAFPNKERLRQTRHQERQARENTRNGADPQLQQLSAAKRADLDKQIAVKHLAIEEKKAELLATVSNICYPMYVTQLEFMLHGHCGLKILFHEQEALKSIIVMLKNYNEMAKTEAAIITSLNTEHDKCRTLKSNLIANTSLRAENANLELSSNSAGTFRASAVATAIAGGTTSLLSAGLVVALAATPLFFIIPGGLGLLTFAALTVALVYDWQKSSADQKIAENEQTILKNETAVFVQDKANPSDLNNMPALTAQIEQSEQLIIQLEKQLKEQQSGMKHLLNKAHNVQTGYQSIYPFLGKKETHEPTAPGWDYDANAFLSYGQPR